MEFFIVYALNLIDLFCTLYALNMGVSELICTAVYAGVAIWHCIGIFTILRKE